MYCRGGLTYPTFIARNGYEYGWVSSFQHFVCVKVYSEEITPFHNDGQAAASLHVVSGILFSALGTCLFQGSRAHTSKLRHTHVPVVRPRCHVARSSASLPVRWARGTEALAVVVRPSSSAWSSVSIVRAVAGVVIHSVLAGAMMVGCADF